MGQLLISMYNFFNSNNYHASCAKFGDSNTFKRLKIHYAQTLYLSLCVTLANATENACSAEKGY